MRLFEVIVPMSKDITLTIACSEHPGKLTLWKIEFTMCTFLCGVLHSLTVWIFFKPWFCSL